MTLEEVIGTALNEHAARFHPTVSKVDTIAAAVRSFMMSDEVVGDAAQAIYECGPWTVRWRDLPTGDTSLIGCVHDARAALTAIGGHSNGRS